MQSFYTKGPQNVPEGYTNPAPSFKKHVWISVLGLLLFMVLYGGLIFWFGRLAYYTYLNGENFWSYILSGGYAFICLFLVKSLFFLTKRVEDPMRRYVTEQEEPVLFDFLYKLADEAKAPRPHKVFITDRVNASVSYDLSIINLIIPSKKNLEIGLGLMNVLSLGEFKAVLAHEFGHFAQRSMLLGRYVYVAQQIAARIIGKRDAFDTFLNFISSIDLRVAWIGWILSILVWAVRALIETCFSVVALAERALSREMEFQADLVAVSLTGSDALIHALKRLQVADEAYSNAFSFLNSQIGKKKAVPNMYKIQSSYIEHMKWVLNDTAYGESPEVATANPASHRIFSSRAYNPPKMWATHPADKDREENAKRNYLSAEIDNQRAEVLLSNPTALEEEMTKRLIATAKLELELITDEEALESHKNENFNWTFLDPKYGSNFMDRYSYLNFETIDELYSAAVNEQNLAQYFDSMYDKELSERLEQYKEIQEEIEALEIAKNEVVTMEKRAYWHRGERIRRKDIEGIQEALANEKQEVISHFKNHDSLCRTVHFMAAKNVGDHWGDYLKNLSNLIHYAEHAIYDLLDAERKFNNVLAVALADGKVSASELDAILRAGNDYYKGIKTPFIDSKKIRLDEQMLKNFEAESYEKTYEELKLDWPSKDNIDRWINVVGSWSVAARQGLQSLRNAALERLLDVEEQIKESYLNKSSLGDAPSGVATLTKYKTVVPGTERKLQRKLKLWDRFMMGEGLFGATAKFAVSAVLVLGALVLGGATTNTNLYVYNGLNTSLLVKIDGDELALGPHSYESVKAKYNKQYDIEVTNDKGELVERYKANIGAPGQDYIYNIASAAVMWEYKVYYGYEGDSQDKLLGTQKFVTTEADFVLKEAPEVIELSSSSKGASRKVFVAYSDYSPYDILGSVEDSLQIINTLKAHSEWDDPSDANIVNWLNMISSYPDADQVLANRIMHYGEDVVTLRAMMIQADSIQKIEFCKRMNSKYENNPDNGDYFYLKARCIDDETQKNALFVQGHKRWQEHAWMAYAAAYVYAKDEQWNKALYAFDVASKEQSLEEQIALDATRVYRISSLESGTIARPYRQLSSKNLSYYSSLEYGEIEGLRDNPNYVYYLLSQGKLQEAFDFVYDITNYSPYVFRLIAASDGATQQMKKAAGDLDLDQGINNDTVWSSFGLALAANEGYEQYIESLIAMGLTSQVVSEFISKVKTKDTRGLQQMIQNQEVYFKGYFYTAAIVALQDKAPKEWKVLANKLLFPGEGPYFNTGQ